MSTILEYPNKFSSMGFISLGEEGDGFSFATGATGSTDTVNVLRFGRLGRVGEMKRRKRREGERTHVFDGQRESLVDDKLDFGNVESTSSDVYMRSARRKEKAVSLPILPLKFLDDQKPHQ